MLFEKLIAIVAPRFALQRNLARIALTNSRAYEAAKSGRRTDGWMTAGTSANSEIASAGGKLRDRARDLVRNNPYAKKAARVFADNFIGTGIIPEARTESAELNKQIMKAWESWINNSDADGDLNFYGLQALIVRSTFESGECLVRCRSIKPSRNDGGNSIGGSTVGSTPVPMQLQVLESEHLDTTRDTASSSSADIRQGIEFDKNGKRAAYWLHTSHPGDAAGGLSSAKSVRIPADEILHIFEKQRPGQIRGVTSFAPILLKLRDLDDYDDAELWRKKIEACFAAFVVQNSADGPTLGSLSRSAGSDRCETFRPGMIEYLKPGEDVRFGSPSGDAQYESYKRVQLHAIAAGLGVTYEQLTGDLSQVNYSSLRAGLLEFRRMIETLRWQMFIPMFCEPVWRRFIDRAYIANLIPKIDYKVSWTPPKFEMVDPVKDAEADTMMMRNGTLTLREAIANRGYDPDSQLTEIARTNELLDKHGIILDSDARKTARNGSQPQQAQQIQDTDEGTNTTDDPKESAATSQTGDTRAVRFQKLRRSTGSKL